jgi:hypothetical protein
MISYFGCRIVLNTEIFIILIMKIRTKSLEMLAIMVTALILIGDMIMKSVAAHH